MADSATRPSIEEPVPQSGVVLLCSIVAGRTGSPIAGASIHLVDSGWEEQSASTDSFGLHVFEGIHAGFWEVTVEARGFRTLRVRAEVEPSPGEQQLALGLDPAELLKVKWLGSASFEGLVLPSRSRSGPVALASPWELLLTREEPGKWVDTQGGDPPETVGVFTQRDSSARAKLLALGYGGPSGSGTTIDDLSPEYCGAFVLSESLPAFASVTFRGIVLQTRDVPPDASEVAFELSEETVRDLWGEVRLRVFDGVTDEKPPGLRLFFNNWPGASDWKPSYDPDGTIFLRDLQPGFAIMTLTADDREPVLERVLILPGVVTDLGTYRLLRLAEIRAQVVDEAGEPAQVAFNVFPLERDATARGRLRSRFFRSNTEGVLKIDSVGRARQLIVANDEGWVSEPVIADTTLSDVRELSIRVSKGTSVAVRLRADPLPGARIEIRSRAEFPIAERICRNRDPMHFRLAPGNYSIDLWAEETWLASETITVGKEPVRLYFPK
jgi:hypothetical protein